MIGPAPIRRHRSGCDEGRPTANPTASRIQLRGCLKMRGNSPKARYHKGHGQRFGFGDSLAVVLAVLVFTILIISVVATSEYSGRCCEDRKKTRLGHEPWIDEAHQEISR
jgi:hypothetical protein